MADYWKSQPRKFCQYCKCWIADNKPSIEFHERGKNHKENVAAKITEIKKKSIDKAKKEERMNKDFAAMEEAALKAYEEDLKRMEREASGLPAQTAAPVLACAPRPPPLVINQLPKQKQKAAKANKKKMQQREAKMWVKGQSEDGHIYYYNSVTGESRWEKPEGFQEESSTSAHESSPSCPWMEAFSPEGYKYYYNSNTGESSWERPADFPLIEPPAPGTTLVEEVLGEPSAPDPEPLYAGDESSDGAQASQEAEASEESSQNPQVPKISFRKRKAEADPVEKEEDTDDIAAGDAPKEEAEEVEKEKGAQSAEKVGVAIRLRKPNPYGSWQKIQEAEDPYAKIDLQLPQVEESPVPAPAELPPEPKHKFKERVITSLGDEGGSSAFRKNKTQNGKSRSLRQRDNDD